MKQLGIFLIGLFGFVPWAFADYLSLTYTANSGSIATVTKFGTSADSVDFCAFDKVSDPSTCSSVSDIDSRYDNATSDKFYDQLTPVVGMLRIGYGGQIGLFDQSLALRYGVVGGLLTLEAETDNTALDGTSLLYGGELELALEKGPIQVLGFYPFGKVTKILTPDFNFFLTGENDSGQRYTRETATYDGTIYAFGGSYIVPSADKRSNFHFDLFKELSEGKINVGGETFETKNFNVGFALKYSRDL